MKPLNRPMFRYGGPIKEGIMSGMKDRPGYSVGRIVTGALSQIPKFFKSQAGKVTGGGQGIAGKYQPAPLTTMEKIRGFFQTAPAGKFAAGTTEGKLIGNIIKGSGVVPRVIKGTAKTAAKSPLIAGSILYYGGGALLPDGTPDPNDPKNYKPAGERGKSGAPGGGDPDMFLTPRTDDPKKTKSEENEALKQKYYKIMGLDKMKKDAVYDSLIDASRIVSEEGGDLKGSLKSGTLQNKIIQAISGQLDKSAALKKQIDAAILKGEIEKDIKANDPAAKLAAEYTKKRIELTDKQLAGGDLSDVAAEYRKQGLSLKGQNLFAEANRKGINAVGILPTEKVDEFLVENPTLTEADFINLYQEQLVEAEKDKLPAGDYVVGGRIITIGEDGKAKAFVY